MGREAVVQEIPYGVGMIAPHPVDILFVEHSPLGEAPDGRGQEGGHRVVLLLPEGVLLGREELPPDGEGAVACEDGPVGDQSHGDAVLKVYGSGIHGVNPF